MCILRSSHAGGLSSKSIPCPKSMNALCSLSMLSPKYLVMISNCFSARNFTASTVSLSCLISLMKPSGQICSGHNNIEVLLATPP